MMEDKLCRYLDGLFKGSTPTEKVLDLKEEMLQNLEDKFRDLLAEGKTPEEAYNITVAGIGDVSALLKQLEAESDAGKHERLKRRTSILTAIGVSSFESDENYRIPAGQIDSVYINWTAGAVNIQAYGGDEIQITEFSRYALQEDEHLKFNINDGVLTINFTDRRILRSLMLSKQLEVHIPYRLSKSLKHLHINTVSGRIEVSSINADELIIKTASGRIELADTHTQTLKASTTSGRIELSTVQADKVDLQTVSGRIVATGTKTQSLQANTTSGRHELSGSFQKINAGSVSGRIEITSDIVPEILKAHTASGRVSVTVPNEGTISVSHSAKSGKFTSEIPISTYAGSNSQFHLSTASGRISIFELSK